LFYQQSQVWLKFGCAYGEDGLNKRITTHFKNLTMPGFTVVAVFESLLSFSVETALRRLYQDLVNGKNEKFAIPAMYTQSSAHWNSFWGALVDNVQQIVSEQEGVALMSLTGSGVASALQRVITSECAAVLNLAASREGQAILYRMVLMMKLRGLLAKLSSICALLIAFTSTLISCLSECTYTYVYMPQQQQQHCDKDNTCVHQKAVLLSVTKLYKQRMQAS
jgi:hypothetical protein